jgi:hypothetical protein
MTEQQLKYYETLCNEAYKARALYDSTIVTLSGGAFGLSLVFLKDVVAKGKVVCIVLLVLAFISWICSLIFVLYSYDSGSRAHLAAAASYSENPETYDYSSAGGADNERTKRFNVASGVLCVLGLALVSFFVAANL